MMARIHSIQEIRSDWTLGSGETAPALKLEARGLVTSGGWSNGTLAPVPGTPQSTDGILDIEFLAMPPGPEMTVTMAFAEISARTVMAVPAGITAVRVHTATNQLEHRLDGANAPSRTP